MKSKYKITLAAIALSLASTGAMAQAGKLNLNDSAYPALPKMESNKTRAEVKQELREAQQDGTLNIVDSQYPASVEDMQKKTRTQVKSELERSKMSGEKKQLERLYRG